MKNFLLFLSIWAMIATISYAKTPAPKTKDAKSKVVAATVFLSGAQVTRTSKVTIDKGTSVIKFIEISPKLDKQSLQVDGEGDFTILSVQHQMKEYKEEKIQNEEIEQFQLQIKGLKEQIKDEQTMITVYDEEMNIIKSHRNFSHPKEGIRVREVEEAANFYRARFKEIKMAQLQHRRTIAAHQESIKGIIKQIHTINTKRKPNVPFSEVYVTINAKKTITIDFKISYLVPQAAWYPSYDLRVKNVSNPMQLAYKATVYQLTDEDWNDAKLTFSTGNPSQTGTKPILQPWQLGYYNQPTAYRGNRAQPRPTTNYSNAGGQARTVSGVITDAETGEPLIGASIHVQGTATGAVTDFNGRYNIQVPSTSSTLDISYVGYNTQQQQIGGRSVMNIALNQGVSLDEVVVTGYGKEKKKLNWNKVKREKDKYQQPAPTTITSTPVAVTQTDKTMSVTFEIDLPYTIPSNGKEYTVAIQQLEIPANYQYSCVPKIDPSVYLTAKVTDWDAYNLLNGNVNLFFEGTFLTKSYLDLTTAKDTLEISLGQDKEVTVKRTKIKDSSKRKFIASNKVDTRTWEIEIENKKRQAINLIIEDQVPVVSVQLQEKVEVTLKRDSGAEKNKKTGQLLWKYTMNPRTKKKLDFKYEVKYPKDMNLVLE